MKILFLIDPNSVHDIKWSKYFSLQSNFDCYFICRKHHYAAQIVKEVSENYNLIFLGTVDYFSIVRPLSSLQQLIRIYQYIKKNQINIFHIQYAEPNATWVLVKYFIHIKVIVTTRGTDVLKTIPEHFAKKDFLNQIVKRLYKKVFQKADWITVTSQKQWDSIQNFSGRKSDFSIIRTGVELDEIYKDTSQFSREEIKKDYILFPRYIRPIYNHEFCLEAIQCLSESIKENYQMVFVGKDGGISEYQILLERIMEEQTDVDFVFLPKLRQEQIWELYKKAALIVMTPLSDGSPVSAMEAIALGKPLILGPLGYDNEIFSVPHIQKLSHWNINELSNKIESILDMKTLNRPNVELIELISYKSNLKKIEELYNYFKNQSLANSN